jgi:hypothetical protein
MKSNVVDIGVGNQWTISFWYSVVATGTTDQILLDIAPASGNVNRILVTAPDEGADNADIKVELWDSAGTQFKERIYDNEVPQRFGTKWVLTAGNRPWSAWVQVTIAFDGTQASPADLRVHINGRESTETSAPTDADGTMTQTSRSVQLGSTSFTDGSIFNLCIWDTMLTSNECKTLFNCGDGRMFDYEKAQGDYASPSNLIHYFRFGADPEDPLIDFKDEDKIIDFTDQGVGNFATGGDVEDWNLQVVHKSPAAAGHMNGSSNRYYTIATNTTTNIGNTFSMEMWYAKTGGNGGRVTFDIDDDTTQDRNRIIFGPHETSSSLFRLRCVDNTGTGTQANGQLPFSGGSAWVHVVGVKDGTSSMRVWINGAGDTEVTSSIPTLEEVDRAVALITEAHTPGTGSEPNVMVHTVRVWNTVLDSDDITALYNEGVRGFDVTKNANGYDKSANIVHNLLVGQPTGSFGTGMSGGDDWITDAVASDGWALAATAVTKDQVWVAEGAGTGRSLLFTSTEQARNNTVSGFNFFHPDDITTDGDRAVSFWFNTFRDVGVITPFNLGGIPVSQNRNQISFKVRYDVANNPIEVILFDDAGAVLKQIQWDIGLVDGQWYFIYFGYLADQGGSEDTFKMYVNGVERTITTTVTDNAPLSCNFAFNQMITLVGLGLNKMNGFMSSMAFWDGVNALSAAEIRALNEAGPTWDLRKNVNAYEFDNDRLLHYWLYPIPIFGGWGEDAGRLTDADTDLELGSQNIGEEIDIMQVSA